MEINSPVGNLVKTIKQVVEASIKYEAKLRRNEAATRATLIDPILRALGWDTTNPELVEFERNSTNTILDYALYDSTGNVRVIVEAKSLGGNLSEQQILLKLVSYCLTYGISNLFLTNGIVWQHFYNLTPGNINPKIIDFLKDPLIDCAGYLINQMDAARFWTVDIKPVETWSPEIPNSSPTIITTPSIPQVPVGLDEFTLLESLTGDLRFHNPPKTLRLPDGTLNPIQYWRDILEQIIILALKTNQTIPIPLVDKAGKSRLLISLNPPQNNESFTRFTYNNVQVYILPNYSANNIVRNALYMLSFIPPEVKKIPIAVSF